MSKKFELSEHEQEIFKVFEDVSFFGRIERGSKEAIQDILNKGLVYFCPKDKCFFLSNKGFRFFYALKPFAARGVYGNQQSRHYNQKE
jgi:hypothetical protein